MLFLNQLHYKCDRHVIPNNHTVVTTP